MDYCQNILSKFNLSINSEDSDECYKDTIKQLNDFLLNDYLINAQTMEKINIEEKESNPDIKKCIYNALYNNDKSIDFNTLINNITISSNFDEKDVIIQIIMLIDENKLLLQDSYLNYGTEIKKTILFYRIIYELYPNATILFEDNVYERKFFEYCASYMLEQFVDKEYLNLLYCLPKDMNKVIDEFLSLQEFVKTLKCDHSSSYLYSKKLRNEYYDLDCKKKKLSIF